MESHIDEDPDRAFDFPPATSPFRGALEYEDPEQRLRERSIAERKHKRRDSYFHEAPWNPMRWITESPRGSREELPLSGSSQGARTDGGHQDTEGEALAGPSREASGTAVPSRLRQARSMPQMQSESRSPLTPKWGRLRSLLPHIAGQAKTQPQPSVVTPANVNITDELISGGLATLMMRLWVERDEKGHRRVPALFHRLRIRVSDSLHPMHGNKAVFRIECEYANGAVRWVVYRQLREFLSLHGHYTLSNAYNRNLDKLPEFPITSACGLSSILFWSLTSRVLVGLPYFKWLKERNDDLKPAEFARMQRETLENYLIGLIRAVVCFTHSGVYRRH